LRNKALKVVAKTGKAVLSIPGLKKLQKPLRKKLYDKAGNSDYLTAGPLKEIYQKTIKQDLSSEAAKITQPTLLIWGSHDTETPLTDGEQLAGLINDSRLEVLDGSHFIYLDYPEKIARHIKEFANS
jgi:pimeloyl-ACP methyl ester carboxylesterase